MVAQFAGFLAVACYLVASGILCYRLANKQTASKILVLSLGAIALPLHGINIQQHIYSTQGLDLGLFNIISLIAWLIACIHIAISSYRPLFVMSIFACPMAAFGLVLSEIFHAPYQPLTRLPKGAESHIILSILAYSVLLMAALHAVLLAIQNKSLKKHRQQHKPLLIQLMPPLQTMESVLFDFIAFGFGLLSLAIISGFISLENMFAQHVAHKTILTIFAWLIFGTLLAGHHWQGWRGQRAVRFTLLGFAFLFVGFLGSKVVLELILQKV